jgi:cephalosporin hydroxylase
MMEYKKFKSECEQEIKEMSEDVELISLSHEWICRANNKKYSYHFEWMGRPIIQYPQDIVAVQELIWKIKPDLIIETGIAHGGSIIFSASMLAQLDMCDAIDAEVKFDPKKSSRLVIGLDIDIRSHNRKEIENHPMSSRIKMIQGSSVDPTIVEKVKSIAANYEKILVFLDSNHTHEHVLEELKAYAPLVSVGSYCIVFDTIIDDFPRDCISNRPWGAENNPKTALKEYLKSHPEFTIDDRIDSKLLISVAPKGYLLRK